MIKKVKSIPIEKVVKRYFNKSKKCTHDADFAFKACFDYFRDERISLQNPNKSLEEAMLRLHAYLANWGMFRPSGELINKNYTVHRGAIEIMLRKEFDVLYKPLSYFIQNEMEENKFVELLVIKLKKELCEYYKLVFSCHKKNAGKKKDTCPSDTLISKIIKAVFGCVVGYDTQVKASLKQIGASQTFNKKSLEDIICFYKFNKVMIDTLASKYDETTMRIIDVYFWQSKNIDFSFWAKK